MQPSILPEDYFAYVFTNALDMPRSLRVPSACCCVLAQPRVCTPSALHHCLCWSDEIGYNGAMAGGKLYTLSWLSCVYRALEEHQSLLSVEPSMLCLLGGRFHGLLGWQFGSQTIRQVQPPQARDLLRSRVSVCQWESRWLLVEDGSNGMWRCGSGVLASLLYTTERRSKGCVRTISHFIISPALVHTIPWILELHQSIKQACSEHAYRGGEAAWPAYCFLPGTRLKHGQSL
jgi:hypothetical protein